MITPPLTALISEATIRERYHLNVGDDLGDQRDGKSGPDLNLPGIASATEASNRNTKRGYKVQYEVESSEGRENSNADSGISEKIMCELRGVVINREEDFVQVKIDDLVIDFPKVLFAGVSSYLKLGQRLRYQVRKMANGRRYQKFLIETDPLENIDNQEIVNLIERLKS